MKKSYLAFVLTAASLLGLGQAARAQDTARVTVPFDFVAGGKTLSAGTYLVSYVFSQTNSGLLIRGNKDGVMLLPISYDRAPVGASAYQTKLAFDHVGDKYFLGKIETPQGVYAIVTNRTFVEVAQAKSRMSSSGTN